MNNIPPQPSAYNPAFRPPIQSVPLTSEQLRMLEDARWASTAPEVQQHLGKLVFVRNKRVVAVGTDEAGMRQEAAAQEHCSEWDFIIELVPSIDYLLSQ